MWLDKLKELKKGSRMSSKQIADATGIPESTVKRIFAGDTDNPYVETLHRIATVLGSSLDEIFVETRAVVSSTTLVELQAEYDKLKAEAAILQDENAALKDAVPTLKAELDRLHLILEHKEKVVSLQEEIIRLQKSHMPNN